MGDEPARRCVGVVGQRSRGFERRDDRTRKGLSELDAELIERVDAEEHRLDKCSMLVQREELAEPVRIELRHHDHRRCAVSRTRARGHRSVQRGGVEPFSVELGPNRVRASSDEERLRLRERVRNQQRLLVSRADARRGRAR